MVCRHATTADLEGSGYARFPFLLRGEKMCESESSDGRQQVKQNEKSFGNLWLWLFNFAEIVLVTLHELPPSLISCREDKFSPHFSLCSHSIDAIRRDKEELFYSHMHQVLLVFFSLSLSESRGKEFTSGTQNHWRQQPSERSNLPAKKRLGEQNES